MFCLTLDPKHLNPIKNMNYIPVGLGNNSFNSDWLSDKSGDNISLKNPYYGEYTFHYWLWKNNKIDFENKWIGFCQYRKFWQKDSNEYTIKNYNDLNNATLKKIPENLEKFDVILGNELFVNQFRLSKFIKHNFKTMVTNPSCFFNEKKRTIKFHFDMMHGKGNLDKAIELLNSNDKDDFKNFINTEVSFNPHNMFLCKNIEILHSYYESIFPWLFECEKLFGFENLKGYGLKRIYGFLAERYMSFWFKNYTKYTILPIIFMDINNFYKDL